VSPLNLVADSIQSVGKWVKLKLRAGLKHCGNLRLDGGFETLQRPAEKFAIIYIIVDQ
jgi:hypothetical protein